MVFGFIMGDFSSTLQAAVLFSLLSGIVLKITLVLVNQKWASTYHHTMTFVLLPLITLAITKTIQGNIALSLGMIGALSIVRFRNPVKNPFELVMFFALITIGIGMGTKVEIGLLLTTVIVLVLVVVYYLEKIARKFNFGLFSISFDEGNYLNTLEIQTKEEIQEFSNNRYLIHFVFNKDSSEYLYRFAAPNKEDLNSIEELSRKNPAIVNIDLRLNN